MTNAGRPVRSPRPDSQGTPAVPDGGGPGVVMHEQFLAAVAISADSCAATEAANTAAIG